MRLELIVKILRWIISLTAITIVFAIVSIVYFWTAKRTVMTQTSDYVPSHGPMERHRFELLQYRFRHILVWRTAVTGGRGGRSEHTFGAWEIEKLHRTEWCGKGKGVLVQATAVYDSGESHDTQLFYDFRTGSMLTTLDHRTTAEAVNERVRGCNAE
jgi:hypothetical protein